MAEAICMARNVSHSSLDRCYKLRAGVKDNETHFDCMILVTPSVLAFWLDMLDGYDTETNKAREEASVGL